MPFFDTLSPEVTLILRGIGVFGFVVYVCGFFALCTGRMDSASPTYFVSVVVAASCVMISLAADFNLSSAMIQTFYILMALMGLVLRRHRSGRLPV